MSEKIILCPRDYFLLQGLKLPHGREWELLGTMLRRKLHEAVVAFPQDIDPQVVRSGSRVLFRSATGTEQRVLVAEGGGSPTSEELPLRSMRGVALLGARAGQTLCVPVQHGGIETLHLLEVAQNAAAAGPSPVRGMAVAGSTDDRVVPFLPRQSGPARAGEPGGGDPGPSAA